MLLVDVTTYNCVSQEWLPQMLDKGIEEVHAHVVGKNVGYNQCFTVSHSKCLQDRSKVAWRLITHFEENNYRYEERLDDKRVGIR